MNAKIPPNELFIKSNDGGHILLHDYFPEFLEPLPHGIAVCCNYQAKSLVSPDFIEWRLDEACINCVRVWDLASIIIVVMVANYVS